MHECCPPGYGAATSEQLPAQDIHRISDPCAAATEARREQSAAHVSPVASTEQRDADARLAQLSAQSSGVQPTPLRPRGRRKRDSSAAHPRALRVVQTAGSASDRQQATVRQADGTYRTHLPGHHRVMLAAISELQQDGPAGPAAPATSLAARTTGDAVAAISPWLATPASLSALKRDPPLLGDASDSATEGEIALAPPSVSDSTHAATTEALAAARVPLTAYELALCVRQGAAAASGEAESVQQLRQARFHMRLACPLCRARPCRSCDQVAYMQEGLVCAW